MIKVFISVPMKGRKKEDIDYSIRKMKRIARAYLTENDIEADNIDFINTIVSENPPIDFPLHKSSYISPNFLPASFPNSLVISSIQACFKSKFLRFHHWIIFFTIV